MAREITFGMILLTIGESTTTMNLMVEQTKADVILMVVKRPILRAIRIISGSVILT